MNEDRTPRLFWPGVVIGWTLIALGAVGVAGEGRDVPPATFTRWVIGLAVVHDLVLVPLVMVVGWGLRRWTSGPLRSMVSMVLVVGGVTVLFAWPYVQGWGASRTNTTIQPRSYGTGLAVLLVAITGAAVLVALLGAVRRPGRSPDAAEEGAHVADGA